MAMTSLDERLLVEAHNEGDAAAFVSIVNEYSASLYAHAVMRLGESRAAEDAVQETFFRAYRAMPRFNGEFHLRAWLHRILTNVCFDEGDRRRREGRTFERLASLADPTMPPADEGFDLDMEFARREVASALASLPDAYREALELRYVEQLSFREVADVTGVTEENARARVHRGRAALRRLINAPYAFIALLVPAVRKGERAAHAALTSGDSPSSVSAIAQATPTMTRVAVELSGPLSTKAGIVAGVVAAAATTVAVPVASSVADRTFAPPPAPVVAAPAEDTDVTPLPPPADATVVLDAASGAAAGIDSAADAPVDPSASAPGAESASAVGEQQTFSAPAAIARSGETEGATPATGGEPSAGATAPADGGSTATPAVSTVTQSLGASALTATASGDQIVLSGAASLVGSSTLAGSLDGSLVVTPGATPDDPVRIDGTLHFVGADGSTHSLRVAMRATVTTAGGVSSYTITAGRFELDDGTAVTTGQMAGAIVVGIGSASSLSLVLS
jgi:RNA polymerase sigma-70 factor (ECF subfamily)